MKLKRKRDNSAARTGADLFAKALAPKIVRARQALALVPTAEIDGWLAEFHLEAETLREMGLKDRLDSFRNHAGDHYPLIASGPSLADLLDKWSEEQKKAVGERALDRLMTLVDQYAHGTILKRDEAAAFFGATLMNQETTVADLVTF